MEYFEKTISEKVVYEGNFIKMGLIEVLLPNGKASSRDIVYHPGASVVIPMNDRKELYMVRQFRKPIDQELLELPAGKLDPGEDPKACAERELKEETGLTAKNLKHLISFYTAPGFCNEILHMYAATGLSEGSACADEDEFISSEKHHVDSLIEKVLNHEIKDAKTIIGILLADKIAKGEIILSSSGD